MTEWKTLRIPKEDYEQAKEHKEEHGLTWGQQVAPTKTTDWESRLDELEDRIVNRLARETQQDLQELESKIDEIKQSVNND